MGSLSPLSFQIRAKELLLRIAILFVCKDFNILLLSVQSTTLLWMNLD